MARRTSFGENLRFKTDSSSDGPEKGVPAILVAGMMGPGIVISRIPPKSPLHQT